MSQSKPFSLQVVCFRYSGHSDEELTNTHMSVDSFKNYLPSSHSGLFLVLGTETLCTTETPIPVELTFKLELGKWMGLIWIISKITKYNTQQQFSDLGIHWN